MTSYRSLQTSDVIQIILNSDFILIILYYDAYVPAVTQIFQER